VIEDLVPLVDKVERRRMAGADCGLAPEFPLHYPKKGADCGRKYILDRLDKLGGRDSIVVTDVGQHQMWAAQFLRTSAIVTGCRQAAPGPWDSVSRRPLAPSWAGPSGRCGRRGRRGVPDDPVRAGHRHGPQSWRSKSLS